MKVAKICVRSQFTGDSSIPKETLLLDDEVSISIILSFFFIHVLLLNTCSMFFKYTFHINNLKKINLKKKRINFADSFMNQLLKFFIVLKCSFFSFLNYHPSNGIN